MQIRSYTITDKEKLTKMLRLNIPEYFAPEEEKEFINYLEKDSKNYFVVEVDNQIIGGGGINYFEEEKTARLSWDLFHPEYRGRGYGSELVKYRIEEIKRNNNINKIVVRTSQHAFVFYEKLGFVLKKITKNYWAEGFNLYQMEISEDAFR